MARSPSTTSPATGRSRPICQAVSEALGEEITVDTPTSVLRTARAGDRAGARLQAPAGAIFSRNLRRTVRGKPRRRSSTRLPQGELPRSHVSIATILGWQRSGTW
jgi:hypothetical protein